MVFLIYLYLMFCVMDLNFTLWEQKDKKKRRTRGLGRFSEYHLDALNSLLSIISLKRKMWCLWDWKKYFDPLSLVLIYVLYISGHKK